jgi:DNA-binding transcriptional regulator LsrR (DeoR family)
VLLGQKGIKDVFTMAKAAELYVVGIGEIGVHAHMLSTRTTTEKELKEVKQAGAVGEVLGRFVDAQGPRGAGGAQRPRGRDQAGGFEGKAGHRHRRRRR